MLQPQVSTTMPLALQNDPFTILLADFKRQAASLLFKFTGINVTSSMPVRMFGFSMPADKIFDTGWDLLVSKLKQNSNVQGFVRAIQQEPKLADAGADMLVSKFSDSVNVWKEKLQNYSQETKSTGTNNNGDTH